MRPSHASLARSERYRFDLSGGRLCLDFTNTVGERGTDTPSEHLKTYGDLLAWARTARALGAGELEALRRRARRRPPRAGAALSRARRLREALYRLLAASATGRRPQSIDVGLLERVWGRALSHSRLRRVGGRFEVAAAAPAGDLTAMLSPVVRSAVELLTSDDASRLRVCADPRCAWLFIDTTRSRTRRWCDMKVCGNRNKVRRFRRGQRR